MVTFFSQPSKFKPQSFLYHFLLPPIVHPFNLQIPWNAMLQSHIHALFFVTHSVMQVYAFATSCWHCFHSMVSVISCPKYLLYTVISYLPKVWLWLFTFLHSISINRVCIVCWALIQIFIHSCRNTSPALGPEAMPWMRQTQAWRLELMFQLVSEIYTARYGRPCSQGFVCSKSFSGFLMTGRI